MFKKDYWSVINWSFRIFLLLMIFFGSFMNFAMFIVTIIVSVIIGLIMAERDLTVDYIAKVRDEVVAKNKQMLIDHPKELAEAKKHSNAYYLTADQYDQYQKWKETLPKKLKYETEIVFGGGGGIGIGITAKTKDGSRTKDLTDYGSW